MTAGRSALRPAKSQQRPELSWSVIEPAVLISWEKSASLRFSTPGLITRDLMLLCARAFRTARNSGVIGIVSASDFSIPGVRPAAGDGASPGNGSYWARVDNASTATPAQNDLSIILMVEKSGIRSPAKAAGTTPVITPA